MVANIGTEVAQVVQLLHIGTRTVAKTLHQKRWRPKKPSNRLTACCLLVEKVGVLQLHYKVTGGAAEQNHPAP